MRLPVRLHRSLTAEQSFLLLLTLTANYDSGGAVLLYIIIAILMFGILIALHEFGHFAAAKLCGVKVNEFAIGMGPKLFHKKGEETEYTIRALPIGGFCAMEGEEEGESPDPRAFPNRPWWQRLIILLAGVFMNFLTGLVIILCLFASYEAFSAPVVGGYTEAWSAQEQGLARGDRILSVDGHRVYLTGDIALFLSRSKDDRVDLEVLRGDKKILLKDFQFYGEDSESGNTNYYLGIVPGYEVNSPLVLLKYAWFQAIDYVRMVWIGLGDLVTGVVGLRDMSGPVEITHMMAQMGEEGAAIAEKNGMIPLFGALLSILNLVSFISINLSVMNLLPIPALDGGQIFFMAVNGILLAIRGRKLDQKYQGWVTAAGFACLMILMLAVTISDILKQFGI